MTRGKKPCRRPDKVKYHPRAAARRQPPVIDWDEAIANLLGVLEDIYQRRG